jgi:hypothetical protein
MNPSQCGNRRLQSVAQVMNRRADHRLPRPVFTQYLPRLAVPGAAAKGQNPPHAPAAKKPVFSPWDNTKPVTDLPIGP